MPDRHSELPAHPDLEYYRKQAKHLLRSYEAGDAAARARVAEVLGDRAAGRFLLSDAQFVLAQEHGFRTWAEFRADIQSQRTTGDRPVSRLWGSGSSGYASQADSLLTDLRRGDPDALQRLRNYVPRYAAATDASTAELRDARLIIARELGFPTWRELVEGAEKSQRDDAERQEERRRLRPEAEALLAGDTARLARLTPGQADTLLQMLVMRELLGTKPGEGLGVPRAAVDVLIGKATSLDLPLPQAIRGDRVEYVRLLLGAGADPGTRTDGITPLETGADHGRGVRPRLPARTDRGRALVPRPRPEPRRRALLRADRPGLGGHVPAARGSPLALGTWCRSVPPRGASPLRRRGPGGRALRHRPARPRDPATPRAAQASIR